MKTQIRHLTNGEKRTVRKADDPKYRGAPEATSHEGYAGTDRETRTRTAERVFSENGGAMLVRFDGHYLKMERTTSGSGKTVWYHTELPEEWASPFVPTEGKLRKYFLVLNPDCTLEIQKNVRKRETQAWRFSVRQPVDESFLEIL